MNLRNLRTKAICVLCLFTCMVQLSCKKLIEVKDPINSITADKVFSTDALATSAMAGIYSEMINGNIPLQASSSATNEFSAGFTTLLTGMSSDEFNSYFGSNNVLYYVYNTNHVSVSGSAASNSLWTTTYFTVYQSNAVLQGVAASTAPALHDSVRRELTAEAKFIRAFSYFYLTNFFGDVPMALTVDFNKTQILPRMPQAQVYQQIIQDLKDAQTSLASDYSVGHGERIIPNKWAATLMLARTYLYTKDYTDAAAQATAVISNNSLFALEPDLDNVFLTTSREAVWQLKQTTTEADGLKNATPEGAVVLPVGDTMANGIAPFPLTDQLLSAFEPGDQRKVKWVDSTTDFTSSPIVFSYFPYKYKIGSSNSDASQPPPQYYMVLRLAEAYLIRAEAEANGAQGGAGAAIADLNIIRNRAGLPNLAAGVDVKAALAQENRIEFFAEWGHRWFDLKRTGQAHSVLSVIPLKQPWAGDYQLLYPIPQSEIIADHFLTQNQGY